MSINVARSNVLQVFEGDSKTCNMLTQQNIALKVVPRIMLHGTVLQCKNVTLKIVVKSYPVMTVLDLPDVYTLNPAQVAYSGLLVVFFIPFIF